MDTTQEIVNNYLKPQHAGMDLDSDSVKDPLDSVKDPLDSVKDLLDPLKDPLDPLKDPLDPLKDPVERDPSDSPLKRHLDRLRGSPVKKPPRINYANYAGYFPAGDSGSDDMGLDLTSDESFDKDSVFDHVSPFKDLGDAEVRDIEQVRTHLKPESSFFPEASEYDRYRLLVASSTEKLLAQLAAEKALSSQLQEQLSAERAKRAHADVTASDYKLLKADYGVLLRSKEALERDYAELRYHSNEARLTKENSLLRQKLAKYKGLYERARSATTPKSVERGRFVRDSDVLERERELERRIERREEEREREREREQEMEKERERKERERKERERKEDREKEKRREREREQEKENDKKVQREDVPGGEPEVDQLHQNQKVTEKQSELLSLLHAAMEVVQKKALDKHNVQSTPQSTENQPMGSIQGVQDSFVHISKAQDGSMGKETSHPDSPKQETAEQKSSVQEPAEQKSSEKTAEQKSSEKTAEQKSSEKTSEQKSSVQKTTEPKPSVQETPGQGSQDLEYLVELRTMAGFVKTIGDEMRQIRTSLAKQELQLPRRQPDPSTCSACSSVESSRPNSESTRDENTQKLMGKYPWNRTV